MQEGSLPPLSVPVVREGASSFHPRWSQLLLIIAAVTARSQRLSEGRRVPRGAPRCDLTMREGYWLVLVLAVSVIDSVFVLTCGVSPLGSACGRYTTRLCVRT